MNVRVYLLLAAVVVVSVFLVMFFPVSQLIRDVMAIPGAVALFGALWQIFRDSSQFEKERYLQSDGQVFALGASSHMSTVAFDKHVEFCEAYMREVHVTVETLFREGPTGRAMDCAQKLSSLKREYSAWIPKSVSLRLEPFESVLHGLGVESHLAGSLKGSDHDVRLDAIKKSYSMFRDLLGLHPVNGVDPNSGGSMAEEVKEEVRKILGINDLVEIREFIIRKSADFARRSS